MNFLSWGRHATDSGSRASSGQQTAPDVVEKLSERLKTATMIEDLRSAVIGLKGYAKLYPLEVGTMAMSSLVAILGTQSQAEESVHDVDTELMQNVLETLNLVCQKRASLRTASPGSARSSDSSSGQDFGGQFTEILIKDPSTVSLFLALFKYSDFYVRYHTILLLSTLLSNKPALLKECILASPLGLSRLIDLLEEPREALRNEGLLLLIGLTSSNTEIQKIIAFENTFDRLLDLIQVEGGLAGGYIVSDCLALIFNLLEYNVSNQSYFRETNCLQRLVVLLAAMQPLLVAADWNEDRERHTLHLLKVIRSLIVPSNPNTAANQGLLGSSGLLAALQPLTLHVTAGSRLVAESLYTVGDLIRGHAENQRLFSLSRYSQLSKGGEARGPGLSSELALALSESPYPVPSLLAVCMICLDRAQPLSHRLAGAYVFECFCLDNFDGQIAIASTWIPPPSLSDVSEKPFLSTGSLMLAALLDRESVHRDPLKLWFASLLLSLTLFENETTKCLAIKHTISAELCVEFEGVSLMHYVVQLLIKLSKDSADLRILAALYVLLIDWTLDSPVSVAHFLAESSHLQYLMESMRQSSHSSPELTGLATYLYGCLIVYQVEGLSETTSQAAEGIDSDYLKSILKSRLGYEVACSRLLRLRECAGWNAPSQEVLLKWDRAKQVERARRSENMAPDFASAAGLDDLDESPMIWFDSTSSAAIKSHFDEVLGVFSVPSTAAMGQAKKPSHTTLVESLKSSLKTQDSLVIALRSQLSTALDSLHSEQSRSAAQQARLRSEIEALNVKLDTQNTTIVALQKEQEDLLVCLAELDHERVMLKRQLTGSGVAAQDDDSTIGQSTRVKDLMPERHNHKGQTTEDAPATEAAEPRSGSSSLLAQLSPIEAKQGTEQSAEPSFCDKSLFAIHRPPPLPLPPDMEATANPPAKPAPPPRSSSVMKMVMGTFLPASPGIDQALAQAKTVPSEPPMAILVEKQPSLSLCAQASASSMADSSVACVATVGVPPPGQTMPVVPPFMRTSVSQQTPPPSFAAIETAGHGGDRSRVLSL